MIKLQSLEKIVKIVKEARKEGRKTSLITGCFDIIHSGHITLFRFAKKHSDIVIVGLENDKNIKLNKGPNRPIHNFQKRSKVLTELQSVDWLFRIKDVVDFNYPNANKTYKTLYKKIQPDFLITNPNADYFWKNKRENAKEIGIELLFESGQKREFFW
jgi:cytidyltransferase-like protein